MKDRKNIQLKRKKKGEIGELLKWILWGVVLLLAIISISFLLKKIGAV